MKALVKEYSVSGGNGLLGTNNQNSRDLAKGYDSIILLNIYIYIYNHNKQKIQDIMLLNIHTTHNLHNGSFLGNIICVMEVFYFKIKYF